MSIMNMGIGVNCAPYYPEPWIRPVLVMNPNMTYQGVEMGTYSYYNACTYPYAPPQYSNYLVGYPYPPPVTYAQQPINYPQPPINYTQPPCDYVPQEQSTPAESPISLYEMTDDGSFNMNVKRRFSQKIFVGNIPQWGGKDTEFGLALECIFRRFGTVDIQWPEDPPELPKGHKIHAYHGFIYLVYEKAGSVLRLLKHCVANEGKLYLGLGLALDSVHVLIRLWFKDDVVYHPASDVEVVVGKNAVSVQRIPRHFTASKVADLMATFGKVLRVEIDVDPKTKYPEGSAVVHLETKQGFRNAIALRRIDCQKWIGRAWSIEIRSFIRFGAPCERCEKEPGKKYCARKECSEYYCDACWLLKHGDKDIQSHFPYQEVTGEATEVAEELSKKLDQKQDGEQGTTGTGTVT